MKIEVLEPRWLFAAKTSISGTVFYDSDASQNQDAREPGLSGWTVYIDSNQNGQYDTGEPTAVTNSKGRYTFNSISAGDYLIGVVDQNSDYQSTPSVTGSVQGRFHIALNFATDMTAAERAYFVEAAERWESVITAMPTSVDPRATQQTITIDANIYNIDGAGGILGQAAPTGFRYDDGLPTKGGMEFDRADLKSLEGSGGLEDVILHEMGHVLGFGTLWESKGLLSSTHNHQPRFTGTNAEAAYKALFGAADTTGWVPVEGEGGDGTANAHWSESLFQEELMTGYAEEQGRTVPLSSITVASMEDLGYSVDMSAADDWNPVKNRTIKTTALDLGTQAYERKVTVAAGDTSVGIDFGYRDKETAPTFKANGSATAAAGKPVILRVASVVDAENDPIDAVTFYQESNGVAGLQTGRGGDTYVGAKDAANKGVYSITAPSSTSGGTQTYYARVTDGVGYGRTRSISVKFGSSVVVASYTSSDHITSISSPTTTSLAQTFGLLSSDLLI